MIKPQDLAAVHFGAEDVCLDRGAGGVHWIHVRAGTSKTSLHIYDGTSSAGDKIFSCEVAASPSSPFSFKPPLTYGRGLFVDVDTNIGDFTICYESVKQRRAG